MKKVIKTLLKAQEAIEHEIEHRKAVFFSRSNNWQESDKGMEFEGKTDELSDMLDSIQDCLENIQD